MYLLMLLATYLAALYQFNLSARPDYDRDVQLKKAMATVSKFLDQHNAAWSISKRVAIGDHVGRSPVDSIVYMLPDDLLYVNNDEISGDNQNINLFYYQKFTDSKEVVYLRKSDNSLTPNSYGVGELRYGKKLYNKDEMVSRVICLDNYMYCTGVQEQDRNEDGSLKFDIEGEPIYKHENKGCLGIPQMCDITPYKITDDPTAGVELSGTCCQLGVSKGGVYLVSFRKVDIRWFNRATGEVGRDFMKSVEERKFNTNVGVIAWNEDYDAWVFTGKMRFGPAYEVEERRWRQTHDIPYPDSYTNMTRWVMPSAVFPENFFEVELDNGDRINYCENGCLFSIKEVL